MTSLSLNSMTVKTSGISIIPTSPECTIYTRPKVLSGHLKITIHFSYKHAFLHLLSYHVKYDERTKIVPVSICTLSLHFAIEMLEWLRYPSKNGTGQWRGVSRVLA